MNVFSVIPRTSKQPSLKKQVAAIKILARIYKINTRFYKKSKFDGGGYCMNTNGKLSIHILERQGGSYLSTFFHELGHVYCYRYGKWKDYHSPKLTGSLESRIKSLTSLLRTGFNAECWVDRWAATELKKWFPDIPYWYAYVGNKGAKKWFDKAYLSHYRKDLKKLKKLKTLTK